MELTLTTPALLFSAISLLLLAYTTRYLTLAGLIRDLSSGKTGQSRESISAQIENLRKRIYLIQSMQLFGVISFFLCVATMLVLFFERIALGEIVFAVSLICLLVSLALSIREISISVKALDIQLSSCDLCEDKD